MSLPEGWEWLDELPEWEPPQELMGPAKSVELNLAIRMLSCDILGKNICALVGRFVTEQSLFTIWFLRDVKGSGRDIRELALISNISWEQTRLVFESWERFESNLKSEGSNHDVRARIQASSEELVRSLQDAIDTLIKARSGTS